MNLQGLIRKLPGKYALIFTILSLTLFLLSNLPLVIYARRATPGTVFPYYHGTAPFDYNVYLSVITLGKNGYWLNRDAFTSENTKPGIFYFYYILVGKLAKITSLWQPLAYHFARIFSVGLFLTAVFLVCREIGGRLIGFWSSILAVTATIPPIFLFGEKEAFITYPPWWSMLEALKRLDNLPHHLFGQALLLISIIFIFKFLKSRNLSFLVFGSLAIIMTGIFFPPAMMPIAFMLPLAVLVSKFLKFFNLKKVNFKSLFLNRETAGLLILFFSSIVPIFISFWQTKQGYPWTVWIAWEIDKWNYHELNFNRALLFSFNLLPLTALPAVVFAIRKEDLKILFLSFWAYMPFLLLPFVNILGIGKLRLIDSVPFIPFSLLTVLSLFLILKNKPLKILYSVLIVFILVTSLPVGIPSFIRNITAAKTDPIYKNLFISDAVWKTIDFIRYSLPADSLILSNDVTGNILAAYAPVKVYFGHINQTMNFADKQKNTRLFFAGQFSDSQASSFLEKNNISYIYYGEEEMTLSELKIDYPFLKKIYEDDGIFIFKFENPS